MFSMNPYWPVDRYHRLPDQHFGLPLVMDDLYRSMERAALGPGPLLRSWRNPLSHMDTGSTITTDKDKFQVCLDVQQFTPEEVSVKMVGNQIIIEGKHEEKEDEHGYISRHFVRKYMLPEGHNAEEVQSSLSSDGVLTISAPRLKLEGTGAERVVPITATGQTHALKSKAAADKGKL